VPDLADGDAGATIKFVRAAKDLTVREIPTRLKVGKTALYEALSVKPG